MSNNLKQLGSRMKELRLSNKLTMRQLSKRLDVHYATISVWEKGKKYPTIENLERFCAIFGVSIKDLWE